VKLKDAANTEAPQLSFQRKAVEEFHSRQAQDCRPPASSTPDSHLHAPPSPCTASTPQNKRKIAAITGGPSDQCKASSEFFMPENCFVTYSDIIVAKKRLATASSSLVPEADGMTSATFDDLEDSDEDTHPIGKGMCVCVIRRPSVLANCCSDVSS
jgi:hypothetical protein